MALAGGEGGFESLRTDQKWSETILEHFTQEGAMCLTTKCTEGAMCLTITCTAYIMTRNVTLSF